MSGIKCRLHPDSSGIQMGKGNQVKILSDPVTVTRERSFASPLYRICMRRKRKRVDLQPGNLLNIQGETSEES